MTEIRAWSARKVRSGSSFSATDFNRHRQTISLLSSTCWLPATVTSSISFASCPATAAVRSDTRMLCPLPASPRTIAAAISPVPINPIRAMFLSSPYRVQQPVAEQTDRL